MSHDTASPSHPPVAEPTYMYIYIYVCVCVCVCICVCVCVCMYMGDMCIWAPSHPPVAEPTCINTYIYTCVYIYIYMYIYVYIWTIYVNMYMGAGRSYRSPSAHTSSPPVAAEAEECTSLEHTMWQRPDCESSIARGEDKFVFLQQAFKSTFGRQVCNFAFVPEKTGWLRKASLYLIFPVNRPLLYQAVLGVSKHKTSPGKS